MMELQMKNQVEESKWKEGPEIALNGASMKVEIMWHIKSKNKKWQEGQKIL
jgi:hypothetical protein